MTTAAESGTGRGRRALVCVCDGDPSDPQTNSGVAFNFITALKARDDVHVVASVSSVPPRAVRFLVQALTIHPSPTRWRQRARRGAVARLARSLTRDFRVWRAHPPDACVLVHIRSYYSPARRPYTSFIDTTVLNDDRNWGRWEDATPRRLSAGPLAAEQRFYQGADLIATASHAAQQSLITDYGINPDRVKVVGGGTNLLPPEDGQTRMASRPHTSSTCPVQILFVGRDFLRKGGDLLLDAAATLIENGLHIRVVIVGCEVADPPSYVQVEGFVTDRAAMRDIYRQSDIFCLPARWEPYGLVVQEAMSSGIPVVVSDVGELAHIVEHGKSGLVVPSEDRAALAVALEQLVSDKTLRADVSSSGRARAMTELTWHRVAHRFAENLTNSGSSIQR